jgi:hypothetical protein
MRLNDLSISGATSSDVEVATWSFNTLCKQQFPLKLDNYQRAYVWTRQKVEQLLSDLTEFSTGDANEAYYLGTLLLHRDEEQRALFVIDGQQRISSLAVIFHALSQGLPEGLNFHYRSPVSAVNLREARQVLAQNHPLPFDHTIFDRLHFTVITVVSEDLAFTFFDTQNSRGVPLKATDLLKAFHLRAVCHTEPRQTESLQMQCARRWESVQMSDARNTGKQVDFAPVLFHEYLWRARNWSGQKRIEWEDHDGVLDTFQQRSVKTDAPNSLPLYASRGNQFASHLSLQSSDDYQLDLNPVQVSGGAASLPFSLRQPIHRGVGFFLYAQKYAAVLEELLFREATDPELIALRYFHRQVVGANSRYLREFFNLALLMYSDRFGLVQLLEFAQRAELVLGALRLEKEYIFKEATPKYLREADRNLLDVIAGAYRPDEVMVFLQSELLKSKGYGDVYAGTIKPGDGVRGRYLSAVRSYYRTAGLSLAVPHDIKALILGSEGTV